jgi:hypothetical protein
MKEWKKESRIFNLCNLYLFYKNYVFESYSGDFSVIFLRDVNIMNDLMTLDLSPFSLFIRGTG